MQVESLEDVKRIFEESNDFLKIFPTKRAYGGNNFSYQLLFDDVKFQAPIIFGDAFYGETTILDIRRLTSTQYYHTVPHIVFNSGEFNLIQFRRFKSKSLADAVLLRENEVSLNEVPLNIEIRGGTFKGAVRFTNSRIGNVAILGGIFEEPVSFERGVYGTITIAGGEFKKGVYFGENNLFPSERTFLPPREGIRPWTSFKNGIFDTIILNAKNDFVIGLSAVTIKNSLTVDLKQADLVISSILCKDTAQLLNGKISVSGAQFDTLLVGKNGVVSKMQLSISTSHVNTLTFNGLLSKDSSVSVTVLKLNNLNFQGFIGQGSVIWDQLLFTNSKEDWVKIHDVAEAQAFNRSDYFASSFYNESGMGNWEAILTSFEPALREIPTVESMPNESKLEIVNSDLGKMTFIQCKLDTSLSFENSKLSELSLVGSTFPTDKLLENTDHTQQRSVLYQLRKVFESNGDSLQARRYKAAELNAYRMEINENGIWEEKAALDLNRWSNEHGESWKKALFKMLCIGAPLWLLLTIPFFEIGIDLKENFEVLFQSLSYGIEFFNPIHKLGFVSDYAMNVAGYHKGDIPTYALAFGNVIDGLWRIVSAYLIYQLIAAFRKHGGKY